MAAYALNLTAQEENGWSTVKSRKQRKHRRATESRGNRYTKYSGDRQTNRYFPARSTVSRSKSEAPTAPGVYEGR